ncbi:hypothetical protein SAMN05660443_0472 [Marinospirillum celere]|uniref:AAA domain-containing protein n=1 Tax=Marinospirillum celere TaxID=1122252 RepID=A0A1I1EAB0_9GAMM|nr:hypothetical protein [Marinospirillum celere]SFB84041.1 hypothetical protein SAMN05660443_0472 [Marinospirillum celere]
MSDQRFKIGKGSIRRYRVLIKLGLYSLVSDRIIKRLSVYASDKPLYHKKIYIAGTPRVGKTFLSNVLHECLGLNFVSTDHLRLIYYDNKEKYFFKKYSLFHDLLYRNSKLPLGLAFEGFDIWIFLKKMYFSNALDTLPDDSIFFVLGINPEKKDEKLNQLI